MDLQSLLEVVSRDHFAYPPVTPAQIDAFEQRVGWKPDPDLRAFYLHCDGVELIKQRPGCSYRVLPLSEIVRARVATRGEDDDQWGPASMYAICYVQDGNYVVLDMGHQEKGRYPLIDGSHDAWPDPEYCGPVANSFSEFLENVLRTRSNLYLLGE